ncbi:MAG: helix-turn-helix domain-containing protein, partial [Planctomycetota bacterium]
MSLTLADRLKARSQQLGLTAAQIAEMAGLNRSFIYDILRGRSENPNLERLGRLAQVLKVERSWLIHGMGDVEGEPPVIDNPELAFVAVPYVNVRVSMGGGQMVEVEPDYGRPYHFQRGWIRNTLRADPMHLRIMHVEGDSMMPTL